MRRTRFDQNQCPIARTSDLLGDWWTPLVLRELLLGRRRFNDIQAELDMNRSVLTQRLGRLVEEGIVERRRYQEHPPRDEFEMTDKGHALWDVLSMMWSYGERWLFDAPVAIEMYDKRSGERISPAVIDRNTGEPLDLATTRRRLTAGPPQPSEQKGSSLPTSSAFPYEKKKISVHGQTMAYVEVGDGDPIVLLHGNPTSSYLWRNIIPHLSGLGRCIAPDLIGMGDSDKLANSTAESYRFIEHRHYLDGLLEQLGVGERIVLIVHDWGSGLGFDWANRHRDAVAGIAYMEAIVRPLTWAEWPDAARGVFQGFRSPAGEEMVLTKNVFVERVLPGSIIRQLDELEMAEYRRPFLEPGEGRRPTLTWPRQIPIEGEPADVVVIASAYAEWLSHSPIPKLLVNAEPGAILKGAALEFCRTWPNQREVTVVGNHFLQEDSPDEIGAAIADWITTVVRR